MHVTRIWIGITVSSALLASKADAAPPCMDEFGNACEEPAKKSIPSKKKKKSKLDEPPTGSARGVVHTALSGTKAPMEFVGLTGGEFTMGSPDKELDHYADEGPRHRVQLSPFEIGKTEVSLAQYELITGKRPNDCKDEGCDDQHPVTNVSWRDAVRFSNALTRWENEHGDGPKLTECYDETTWKWRRECTGYRLPTDAEWEMAARAGTTTRWSFGAHAKDICKYANVDSSSGCDDGYSTLAPVESGTLRPNGWGLHGMHGNAPEWVFDVYAYYNEGSVSDPAVISDGDRNPTNDVRVSRGGSFYSGPEDARSAFRDFFGLTYTGFRCARGAIPPP